MKHRLEIWSRAWPMEEPFAISRGVTLETPTVQVRLTDPSGHVGRGEGCGVPYHDETPASMAAQIEEVRGIIEAGIRR